MTSRFRKPPYDPGQSDFPSPVLTLACPPTAFPKARRLKRWRICTPLNFGSPVRLGRFTVTAYSGSVSGSDHGPPSAQSPFARSRCYLGRRGVSHHVGGHYSSFIAHTGSCARPNPSRRLRSLPWPAGPCRLSPVPAGRWPFPTLSLQSLPRCLDPYPAVPSPCTCSFLPGRHRPHVRRKTFGTPHDPCNATSTGRFFSRLQSFANVQAPRLARPPGRTHRRGSVSPGRPGRLHHAPLGWLPAPSCGIATCPTRATDTAGLSPAGLQPCRLLLRPETQFPLPRWGRGLGRGVPNQGVITLSPTLSLKGEGVFG